MLLSNCRLADSSSAPLAFGLNQFAVSVLVVKIQLPANWREFLLSISTSLRIVRVVFLALTRIKHNIFILKGRTHLPATTRKEYSFRYLVVHFSPNSSTRRMINRGRLVWPHDHTPEGKHRQSLLEQFMLAAGGISRNNTRLIEVADDESTFWFLHERSTNKLAKSDVMAIDEVP